MRIMCVPNGLSTFTTHELILVAAVIDQLNLLLFNRVAALGGFGARLWLYGDLWYSSISTRRSANPVRNWPSTFSPHVARVGSHE